MKKDDRTQTQKKCSHEIDSCKGFTLIELSIVLLITSIMMIPLVRLYTDYLQQEKIIATKDNLSKISRSIALFSPLRYPCPSDRSLPPTDPNYGVEVCSLLNFTLAGVPDCNTTGAEQGLCKTPGARDTDADLDGIVGNNEEFVLIGGVPIRFEKEEGVTGLRVREPIQGTSGALVMDAWNNQFTYAVSYTSTAPTDGFTRFKNGVIRVVDEWGNDTAGTNKDAHFMIISHGQNGSGAYNNWQVKNTCVLADRESQNCNGDSEFMQGVSHYGGTIIYDDYSYVQTDNSSTLWRVVTDPANDNAPTNHIATIPMGVVGVKVGTDEPGLGSDSGTLTDIKIRLDVKGDIRADTIRAAEICKKDGTNCLAIDSQDDFFGPQKTAGPFAGSISNDCPTGQVISVISGKNVTCSNVDIKFTGTQTLCPLGTWVEQVLTNGTIKCTNGVICPGGIGCS